MSEPFLGEILMTGFNFAPPGFALCNGQLLPISSYTALFSILGTTYGGDGETTFGLPDLRGRVPLHKTSNSDHRLGSKDGTESENLIENQMPLHNHTTNVSSANGTTADPTNNSIAAINNASGGGANLVTLNNAVSNSGGQSHENMQPSLVINFVIAITGVFPS